MTISRCESKNTALLPFLGGVAVGVAGILLSEIVRRAFATPPSLIHPQLKQISLS